ncbi:MAG: hypothetical protein GF329_07070 [Candidatus Lokiarchaeota archaeon]|nr:hypothetical protein [Candidatus Lokiarchaeota archaeon]
MSDKASKIKYIVLPIILLFLLLLISRILLNYFYPVSYTIYKTEIPYFNWASDPWTHYAIVRDSIEYNYYGLDYMNSFYDFFYPIFYTSTIGLYYLTGLNLFSLFKIMPIFIGSFAGLGIVVLTKNLTDSWKKALMAGLLIAIASPFFLSFTNVMWPQLIGQYLIIVLILSFYRMYKKQGLKEISLFIVVFCFLVLSHVISMVVGGIIMFSCNILLIFKRGLNWRVVFSWMICNIFLIFWTMSYYYSAIQMILISYAELILYLGLSLGFLGLSTAVLYVISRKINGIETDEPFKLKVKSKIFIGVLVVICFNPYTWLFFPLTRAYSQFIPVFSY